MSYLLILFMVTRGLQVDGEFAFGKTVEHSSSTAIINRDFEIIYLKRSRSVNKRIQELIMKDDD